MNTRLYEAYRFIHTIFLNDAMEFHEQQSNMHKKPGEAKLYLSGVQEQPKKSAIRWHTNTLQMCMRCQDKVQFGGHLFIFNIWHIFHCGTTFLPIREGMWFQFFNKTKIEHGTTFLLSNQRQNELFTFTNLSCDPESDLVLISDFRFVGIIYFHI